MLLIIFEQFGLKPDIKNLFIKYHHDSKIDDDGIGYVVNTAYYYKTNVYDPIPNMIELKSDNDSKIDDGIGYVVNAERHYKTNIYDPIPRNGNI